eukprot:6016764-Karenia_brevis.AAC.1
MQKHEQISSHLCLRLCWSQYPEPATPMTKHRTFSRVGFVMTGRPWAASWPKFVNAGDMPR